MSISITGGPGQEIKLDSLKDLENSAMTLFKLGKEIVTYFDRPLSEVPDNIITSIQYDSGNQKWAINNVGFVLSGGVTGHIEVVRSGKLYDYTDSFPTEVELGLNPQDNSDASTTSFTVDDKSIYVGVELDFCIDAGVSITTAATSFGLSGSASAETSDTFKVAFYKKCAPTDTMADGIGKAFKSLVLPFHSGTIQNLQPGDILMNTAGANLQLGLGAGIGFGDFSVANQVSAGIPHLPKLPKLNIGLSPEVSLAVNLAYTFSYAGTFEQTLWRQSDGLARLHVYKSTEKIQSLDLTAGVTLNVNLSAEIEVEKQILNAPANATSDPNLQQALTTAFSKASDAIGSLAGDINDKIKKLFKPVNQDLSVYLDLGISNTKQTFLLTDYTLDLTKDYAAAWNDMINGRFVDALADGKGSVKLAVGSGLEKLYAQTTSIGLNFFGQWAAQWSESSIANSKLIYAGNNLFHLVTSEGMQQVSRLEQSTNELDFYFSTEMDLAGSGTAAQAKPDLNAILKASNNPAFGARIAMVVAWLTRVSASQGLINQIKQSLQSPNSTQVLHVIIPYSAYKDLDFSKNGAADDAADRRNYAAFAAASKTTMPDGTVAQFVRNTQDFSYDFWKIWNIAVTDAYPPPEGSHPDRKGTGPADAAQKFLDPKFGPDPALRHSIQVTMQAASEFMNMCEDLKGLSGDNQVGMNTWNDFASRLGKIANKDTNFDFIVPAVLALTQLCGSGVPKVTVGPAAGISGEGSIGVTMVFG
jgi:hypothetical protein